MTSEEILNADSDSLPPVIVFEGYVRPKGPVVDCSNCNAHAEGVVHILTHREVHRSVPLWSSTPSM